MAFDRTRTTFTTSGATFTTAPIVLRTDFAELIGFKCVSTGDTSTRVKITDADSRVVYLDAADANYTTGLDRAIALDDTVTGLSIAALSDSTGAAATISGGQGITVRSPLTVDWSNGTSGDTATIDIYTKFPIWRTSGTILTTGSTVSTVLPLRVRYAQVTGFRARGLTDNASRVQIADADGRTVYLDAADKDYSGTGIHRGTLTLDDTATGLSVVQVDATGAAATATSAGPLPVVKGPLTVSLINAGTAGETLTIDVFYRM